MKKLLIVRHGQTEFNRRGIVQGHVDSDLTPLGVRQAERLGERLATEGIERIISSDLGRTIRTANIINDKLGLTVEVDARIRERDYGIFEARPSTDYSAAMGEVSYLSFVPANGEAWSDIFLRTEQFLRSHQLLQPPHQTTLLVAHSGTNRGLLRAFLGLPDDQLVRLSQGNCCLNVVEWLENGTCSVDVNNVGHLHGLPEN